MRGQTGTAAFPFTRRLVPNFIERFCAWLRRGCGDVDEWKLELARNALSHKFGTIFYHHMRLSSGLSTHGIVNGGRNQSNNMIVVEGVPTEERAATRTVLIEDSGHYEIQGLPDGEVRVQAHTRVLISPVKRWSIYQVARMLRSTCN
jgi:hypothetical protein